MTRRRVCNQPGCPELITTDTRSGRCPTHTREADKARGTTSQRGYGTAHQRTRAALLPDAYGTPCLHCGNYMWPHQALDLDHTDDRTSYRGIVHAHCNRGIARLQPVEHPFERAATPLPGDPLDAQDIDRG